MLLDSSAARGRNDAASAINPRALLWMLATVNLAGPAQACVRACVYVLDPYFGHLWGPGI